MSFKSRLYVMLRTSWETTKQWRTDRVNSGVTEAFLRNWVHEHPSLILTLEMLTVCIVGNMMWREWWEQKGFFSATRSMCSSQNEFRLIYMWKSHRPPSLSWREKLFRKTAEINQCVGPWCILCGLGQRWNHCERPLALMMCSEPVEACKSAAGISFSTASVPPWPLRYLCQSHLCSLVSGSSVAIVTTC